ncbi:unnamed protein product [Symbiodinium natans]|uniref:Uncharacterized protein n=1 Tax=Symbiodinium natans TaxID=878477 RepID=A0A812NK85_9DINO|nr:unnamed protein product [Symbiodinium natans]
MPLQFSELNYQCMIGAAFRVCAEVGEQALPWAEEILSWCKKQTHTITAFEYGPLLVLFEQCRQRDRVDRLLFKIIQTKGQSLNEVHLGSLINAAGSDWKRVETIWDLLVNQSSLKPNIICYRARSKAHLLAGRPATAAKIIRDIGAAGMPTDSARTVTTHLQAMLIVSHAELTKANKRQLKKCLSVAGDVDLSEAGKGLAAKLKQLIKVAEKLLSNPSSLRFADLLVLQFAQEGAMGSWPQYAAGSKYLAKEESEREKVRAFPCRRLRFLIRCKAVSDWKRHPAKTTRT